MTVCDVDMVRLGDVGDRVAAFHRLQQVGGGDADGVGRGLERSLASTFACAGIRALASRVTRWSEPSSRWVTGRGRDRETADSEECRGEQVARIFFIGDIL